MISSLAVLAGATSRQTHPDLGISDFSTNVTRPQDGESITLSLTIHNYGILTANSATVNVYDDEITEETLIETRELQVVFSNDDYTFGFAYNTTGKRGTRTLYAMLMDIEPLEKNSTWKNNNATLELVILNDAEGFDWVFDGSDIVNFDGLKRYKGYIAVYDTAKVTYTDCDIDIQQDREYQYGILVADNSRLDIRGCSIYSNYPFYITISDNGKIWIDDSTLTNATIRSINTNTSADLWIGDSSIDGGLQVGTPMTTISGSSFIGDFVFTGGVVTITESDFYLREESLAGIDDTMMTADEIGLYYEGKDPTTIWATGGSFVVLKRVWDMSGEEESTVMFDALDTSRVEIWRELSIHVADTTDLPIAEATVEVYSETMTPVNLFTSNITDANGDVEFLLMSDIIVLGNDGYKGNYIFLGKFTDDRSIEHTATVTYRLALHPSLMYNDSHDHIDLIFDPVPPKAPENCYKPTGTLYNGASLGLSGCMQVTSTVKYVNSTITILQDRDFQAAIYIEGSGQLILKNTTVSGIKRMNIYMIGASAYLRSEKSTEDNSMIKANALVGVDGNVDMNTVDIYANIRGKYKNFNVGQGSLIRGTWLSEAASMSVYDTDIYSNDEEGKSLVTGGSLSIGGGNFYVTHFELNSTALSAITGSDMWGNSLATNEDPLEKRWYLPGSSIILRSSGTCQVINSEVHYDIFELHCKAFNAEKSTFNRDIIYDAEATSGSLKSISAPAVTVLGDATVKVFFHVSIDVSNALGGPIADAPITITRMGGARDDMPSPTVTGTDGYAEFLLLAEKITSGNLHEWMGNYRVTVEGCPEADPYDFSVGGGKGDQTYEIMFSDCVPDIEGIQYITLGLNRTIIKPPNNSIMVSGVVRVIYEGGITLPPADFVDISVYIPSQSETLFTETGMGGDYNLAFELVNKGLMPEDMDLIINATYANPSDPTEVYRVSQRTNITVLPEKPVKLKGLTPYPATPGTVVLTNKDVYKAKEAIIVSGQAFYDTGTPVPAGSSVQVQILGTLISASSTTGQNGIFTIQLNNSESPGKDKPYMIQTKVTATHPYYTDLTLASAKQDTIIIEGKEETDDNSLFWIIIILVIVIVVVVVVVILVYMRMKTWGTLVECGECGEFISETATKCPKCGTEFEREVVKCSECDAWIPSLANECPKCGVKFKELEEEAAAEGAEQQPPQPGQPMQPMQPGMQPMQPQQPVEKVHKVKKV